MGLADSSKGEHWSYVTFNKALVRGITVKLYNYYNCLWLMDLRLGLIYFYARIIARIPSEF